MNYFVSFEVVAAHCCRQVRNKMGEKIILGINGWWWRQVNLFAHNIIMVIVS
jgi:hypothetical protein